jgi:1-acyl-sn-glycerol-3-phosphate acyltransferase
MIAAVLAGVCHLISGASVRWLCDPYADVQRIYFGNHSSHLDFIVIWSALPPSLRRLTRPVAGRDYWNQGAVRRYLAGQVFRAVLIERGEAGSQHAPAAARVSVQRIAEAMGDRNSVIVFPEGTRSLNGEVGSFRSGLYHISRLRPDAELIPVYIENLKRILPKGEILPVPMLSRGIFSARLYTSADETKQEFLSRAHAALTRLGVVR